MRPKKVKQHLQALFIFVSDDNCKVVTCSWHVYQMRIISLFLLPIFANVCIHLNTVLILLNIHCSWRVVYTLMLPSSLVPIWFPSTWGNCREHFLNPPLCSSSRQKFSGIFRTTLRSTRIYSVQLDSSVKRDGLKFLYMLNWLILLT